MPVAKLQNGEKYSILTDHLGTPIMAVNSEGEKVWSRELDIYGKTKEEKGQRNFIPFLYQGQYFDEETGLAYNRFRYYSPDSGTYISQDPIGLEGGMPNMYSYVHDSNAWIDPFGLECFKNNPKKKVNSANVDDIVRTPTTHPEDFVSIKNSRNLKNTNTGEIWQKSFTNHSHSVGGEWKVGIGKSSPSPTKKITVSEMGRIIKINK